MERKSTVVSKRLTELREGVRLSQAKLAAEFEGVDQPAIFRYENALSFPPYKVLMQYADFFDVSLDYIFGRTDNPQGKLYDFQPKIMKDNKQMRELIEMCFDPNSPANAKLKEILFEMMKEQNK
ncbi:MAG: helix-turn-helix transcriptional regulator [Clostridia bacterium]|nr:helix-turn-helix transcriptional regulator [Clostridia bacterium]